MKTFYFDYNATTLVAPEVLQEMGPYFRQNFANPSSLHHLGRQAARALREARKQAASLIGASDDNEIIFTSGGTESNNTALRSALSLCPDKKQIVISHVEHSSIYKHCLELERQGFQIDFIHVDSDGCLDLNEVRGLVSDNTAIVSIMLANNETGVIFPIEEISKIIKEKGILFHVDAVQAAGKLSIDFLKNGCVDFLSIAAHKFYGPKGIGALYIRNKTPFRPLIFGGSQERGRRAGTENPAGIAGMGAACRLVRNDLAEERERLTRLRDEFEKKVSQANKAVTINGGKSFRLSNTSNLRFEGVDGEALLFALDQKGICASSGSACMSGSRDPSHVLKAMGLSDDDANSSLRFSFGRWSTESEIEEAVPILTETVDHLRSIDFEKQHRHPVGV